MLSHIRPIFKKDENVRLYDNITLYNKQTQEKNKIKFILPQKMTRSHFIALYRVIQNDCRGAIVQRQFRTKFGKQPPSDNSIRRRYA